jgi:hypothetical protein
MLRIVSSEMPDRSEEFADLIAKLEAMSPGMTLLCGIVEVRSCLTTILGNLQLIEMGAFGPLPEPMVEPVGRAISSAREAVELYGVLIGGVGRLPTDAPPSEPAEGKE